MKKTKEKEKGYIVTYRSQEHFEVLGWVWAKNRIEARKKAYEDLKDDIKKYNVSIAEIAEYKDPEELFLD